MREIRDYLDERDEAATRGLERGTAARMVRRVSTPRLRFWAKQTGSILYLPSSKRKISRLLASGEPIRLNLGSGPRKIPGWVNIDILGMNPDLIWDLRRGVPFPDGSAQGVFLEHVLEHFPLADVFGILEESVRVVAPGGIIRVGVPDFGRYLESYAGDGEFIERLRPGRPTPLLALSEVALRHGHRSVWDGQTLERVLAEAGLEDVRVCKWGESTLDPVPDTPMREPESVYAEGRKPAR
jgi:predicted SAM-dependent methyltransferase